MPHCQDAEDLFEVFKQFGLNLDRLNYAKQTAQLNKLIEALQTDSNKTKLKNLHLDQAMNNLMSAQKDFEYLYTEQEEANANLRNLPSATQIKKDLEAALRNYFSSLKAMKDVDGWQMIYANINEVIKSVYQSN